MMKFLEGTFELIQQSCRESLEVGMAITLSAEECAWSRLPVVYDKARQVQHYRAGDGERMVQKVQLNEAAVPDTVRDRFMRDKVETLAAHLEAGRKQEFLRLYGRWPNRRGRTREGAILILPSCITRLR